METSITKIGNSRGVIIPAHLIKQCGLEGAVTIQVKNDALVITKARKPRDGWADSVRTEGADNLIINEQVNDFDEQEWTW